MTDKEFIQQNPDAKFIGSTLSFDVDSIYPATKEQSDLLFQKIKEEGYEWDADKKELKKISQRMISAKAKEALYDKPAWSEEDEKNLKFWLDNNKSIDSDKRNWLETLKDRVQPQPKQEWSEEDESMLTRCIGILGKCYMKELPNKVEEELKWLKSLKSQNQRNV